MPKRSKYYNVTNTCDRCENKLIPGHPYREYNKDGNWTGKWLCKNCYDKEYSKIPGCGNSLIKEMRDSRIGNLDPNSSKAKGDMFETITCKVIGVKNLNIENDNFHSPIDHDRDAEHGVLQSKGAILNTIYQGILEYECWMFNVRREHGKEFDNMIAYCVSKDRKNIERVYIIPRKEIVIRQNIFIYKNSIRRHWYDKYRIDEKSYNDVYHDLNKDVKII